MDLQPVFDLVQICHLKGIKHAVISPGSRNAALTIAFARHPKIQCYSVPDERSAAFIAIGISLKTKLPTALICTSGSAALNYAPAVAEAFFNQVPLLLLSADRPPEWIGQRDGQTIFQENLFGKHVKKSYTFPSLIEDVDAIDQGHSIINEAVNISLTHGPGPVHINIPFREPFYPSVDKTYSYKKDLKIIQHSTKSDTSWATDLNGINEFPKVLIIIGQKENDQDTNNILSELSSNHKIPIVADIISNAGSVNQAITSQDVFLKDCDNEDLKPDLLITIGMSVISKNLKLYLRKYKPKAHWHVRDEITAPDTYQALKKHFSTDALLFLTELQQKLKPDNAQSQFYSNWQKANQNTKQHIAQFYSESFSDFNGYRKVLEAIPSGSDLHLANSMAVRYANVIGLAADKDIEVFCNRGTSGIDGSNSTAVGTALMSKKTTFLLTGDLAFLYDRNAFWHNHVPDNLNIVVFNNHGGGIFRMIDGPSQQPELKEFFETNQKNDAKLLAKEYDYEYYACHSLKELNHSLKQFVEVGKRKILEIFTDAEESKQAYKELFKNRPK